MGLWVGLPPGPSENRVSSSSSLFTDMRRGKLLSRAMHPCTVEMPILKDVAFYDALSKYEINKIVL